MFFGLDMEKLLLIGLLAVLVVGPERLPRYAESLGRFTRNAREWFTSARDRVKTEMGEDFDDVEWRKLDPRQYDPRRIIREALLDEPNVAAPAAPTRPVVREPRTSTADRPERAPFDSEAT